MSTSSSGSTLNFLKLFEFWELVLDLAMTAFFTASEVVDFWLTRSTIVRRSAVAAGLKESDE